MTINLQNVHKEVHALFCNGYHVIRRSDRYWGGLSTDLVIEQVLMRSIKSTGGLTRGRGLGSSQRTLWLLSMSACSEVHEAMQNLTATQNHLNKEHVEASNSRKIRDSKDIVEIEDFLKDHNP